MDKAEAADVTRDPWVLPAFLGVARLPINSLSFDHELFKQHRPVSDKIVDRLRTIFQREGCLRTPSQNWIDALVDPRRLRSALARNGLTQDDLRPEAEKLPLLELGPVDCLQGIHRILAASDFLNQNDRWWTVRLYCSQTLPETTSLKIIEGSLNEQPHSDGEIFRKIRIYYKEGNKKSESKWWARLTPTKQKDLKQLLKNPQFAKAFDDLIDMPGLWYSIKLGTLHRLLTLRCDEELLRYLRHVHRTWRGFISGAGIAPEAIDRDTVERLELLAPGTSKKDRKLINDYVGSGEIFQEVTHESARQGILQALTSVPGLIPSLRSFFENLKYLEPCSNILRKLVGPKEKRTIFQSLSGAYFAPSEHSVEYAERRRRAAPTGRGDESGLWMSYVQLWAFCFRHFPSMTQLVPRKELGKDKPAIRSNAALWHYLGDLAVKLGFRTEQAERFQQQNPYRTLAQQFLTSQSDSPPDSRVVARMALILKQADKGPAGAKTPQLTDEQCLSKDRRCGRPFDDDFTNDKGSLFLPFIYEFEPCEGLDISPFFVKRDIFLSFLGNKYENPPDDNVGNDDGVDPDGDTPMNDELDGSSGPSETQQLQSDLRRMEDQNHQLKAQLDRIRGQKRELEEARDVSDSRHRELERERQEITNQLSARESQLAEERQRASKMEQEIKTLKQELAILEGEHNATDVLESHPLDPAASELGQELSMVNSLLKIVEVERDKLKADLEAVGIDRDNYKSQVAKLNPDLEVAKKSFEEAANRINALEVELAAANNEVRELAEKLKVAEDYEEKFRGAQEDIHELEEKIRELRAGADVTKQQLHTLQQENKSWREQHNLEERMELVTEDKANQAQLEEQVRRLQKELENSQVLTRTALEDSKGLRQKLQESAVALATTRTLRGRNKALQRQLELRQSQSGVFKMLQASMENLSEGRENMGSFHIVTSTAVITIGIPNSEKADDCIKEVITAIHAESQGEQWAMYFRFQKVIPNNWTVDYIRSALEQYGTCMAGPEALLLSMIAKMGSGSREKLQEGSNRPGERANEAFSVLEIMHHWIESEAQDRRQEEDDVQMGVLEEAATEDDEGSPSASFIGPARAMIEGGSLVGDEEGTSQEAQSLALVRQRDRRTP